MALKDIFTGVVILLIALFIFSYITDASTKYKVKDFLNSIKNSLPKTLESNCPQIDVSMGDLDIEGKTYDGWTIKGKGNCRKGTKEGENVNMYYCGGYSYGLFNIGEVNVYVEKTSISDGGNIGKTYKYVIWNIYDENEDFVETRCLGNPDDFYEKQAEDFGRQLVELN